MDTLPDPLIIEILSRLNNTAELTRCKCVSKTLNRLARQVRSIHLYCSLDRFTKLRSPEARWKFTPFKTIFHKLISKAEVLIESVSLGVDTSVFDSLDYYNYDYEFEEECDDLFLTSGPFSAGWMAKIGQGLKSILISDFPAQSVFNKTNILELLSCNCHNLVELMLGNNVLCVEDMRPMPLLTRLTLKDVEISDSHLNKLMECLPCLQVLILVQKCRNELNHIHHLNLKELKCMWEDFRSITIFAPKLTKLEFVGVDLAKVSIHAPLLSYFHLTLASADEFNLENFSTLKTLRLVSWQLQNVLSIFPSSTTVEDLTLVSADGSDPLPLDEMINFSDVFTVFPKVTSLTLGSDVWSQLMLYPLELSSPVAEGWRSLKQVTVYLALDDIDKALTFILYVKKICSKSMDIVLFIHSNVDLSVASSFVSLCTSLCLKVRSRWGTWEKGAEE